MFKLFTEICIILLKVEKIKKKDTRYQQSILILCMIFICYSIGLFRIIMLVFAKKIKKDIYLFALKDKVNYMFLIAYLLIAYFHIS